MLGYISRTETENFIGKTFPEVGTTEFNAYITYAEDYINKFLGVDSFTTTSGILAEAVQKETTEGFLDEFTNLVIPLKKPPVQFDANDNPRISEISVESGLSSIPMTLTDGNGDSILLIDSYRSTIVYPNIYLQPYYSTFTPSRKLALMSPRSYRFMVKVSYVGGYYVVPGPIKLAAMKLVQEQLLNRTNPQMLESYTQGRMSEKYMKVDSKTGKTPAQMAAEVLLSPYRRVVA